MGKAVRIIREHLSVIGGGPLVSEARLDLCGTCRRGLFVSIDWVELIGEAHVIMAMQSAPGRDHWVKVLNLGFCKDGYVVSEWCKVMLRLR